MKSDELVVCWFRRDLRLDDNAALSAALKSGRPVLPLFIFDQNILENLDNNDARVTFIYGCLKSMQQDLTKKNSSILVEQGRPQEVWNRLVKNYTIKEVFFNRDYEPYALNRDQKIEELLRSNQIKVTTCKDQVIFEKSEVTKDNGEPYIVYTPYKNKWLEHFSASNFDLIEHNCTKGIFYECGKSFPSLPSIGFEESSIKVKDYTFHGVDNYQEHRDYPAKDDTSYLSPHLRFGTVSIRKMVAMASKRNETFLSELIWREFFMQILFHYPKVVTENFRSKYDGIKWRNNEDDFKRWCEGTTGYPIVDAAMRQLNQTGYMHNRVRMVTASFLCKHLLIDWRWGEAYFASKLLDYELASNNGNWQWCAGTGCDASPYFRVFNPTSQQEKFDKDLKYIRTWVSDFDEPSYPEPMVDHKMARERAIKTYKEGIGQ